MYLFLSGFKIASQENWESVLKAITEGHCRTFCYYTSNQAKKPNGPKFMWLHGCEQSNQIWIDLNYVECYVARLDWTRTNDKENYRNKRLVEFKE